MASLNLKCLKILIITTVVSQLTSAHAVHAEEKQTAVLDQQSAEKLFALKVYPLVKVKCFGCHGADPEDIRGDYDLLTRAGMLKGGESGETSIVPGHPEESPLYDAVLWNGMEMPPKENDRLTKEETEQIRQWIAAGAPWPDAEARHEIQKQEWSIRQNEDGVIIDTSGGIADDWTYRRYQPEDLWAFQPINKSKIPEPFGNPVDYFINKKLQQAEVIPAESADFRTLVRRAYYDLIGLPPTSEELSSLQSDWERDREQTWKGLINQLLDSKHYGERWAQHWLDVVRYADTGGFSNDYERSNAWRYRDYVIRAFNNDEPFNEFIIQQIAGDEYKPDNTESLIATGFLRMGPWGTAMIPQDEARQIYLDDLVHNVGQSFLSMPMRCCKCHDHKFDPLPTRDYYSMYSAFATTQPAEMPAEFLPEENLKGFTEKKNLVEELLNYARAERDKVLNKQEAAAKKWYAEHDLPYKSVNERKNDPEDQKPPRHVGLTPEEKGILKVREQDVWIWERRLERYEPMAQAVYNGQDDWKNARKLRTPKQINNDWRPQNFILMGGALDARGPEVQPGVLSATGLPASPESQNYWELTDGLSGRRLGLAKWIAHDENPLTARSIVNRIWQHHFGKGLVKTANNFGAKGSKPTHPELLDWLTADFIEHGWKIKRLHRMIMSSQTYQRSGISPDAEKLTTVDPDNTLLATYPPRRLTAEELRDTTLLISGELNREMGGVPIMPEMNMEVALQPRMIQFSIAPAHQPSRTPEERNRRTIYTYRVRGQADPLLEIMNLPNPNESCEIRDSASVTPQAFTLFNSDVMHDRSIALAARILEEGNKDSTSQITRAFELSLNRQPSATELEHLATYLKEMQTYHQQREPEVIEYPTEVTRSLVEEFTGEPFEFIEKLNVYNDYIPDKKPWTVNSQTRALSDICLLLMNSNEFLYVY